jgi:hypothetical protein
MSATSRSELLPVSALIKTILIWLPIVGGLVHQFLMFLLNTPEDPYQGDGIWVFVNPPGYVYPFVSLEFTWWFVLLLASATMAVMAYSHRIQSLPSRFWVPAYGYILFLLILVKPV